MPTMYPQVNTPYVWNAAGLNEHGFSLFLPTSGLDTHVNAITPDCWVYPSTNGLIAVPSSFTAAYYRVIAIRDANQNKLTFQGVSTTALNIDSAIYRMELEALGGLTFAMSEDGLGTPISDDPSNGWPGKPYAPVLITDGATTATPGNPIGAGQPTMLIDSSAIQTSPTNMSIRIIGVAPVAGNPAYSATAGSKRLFLVQAYNPGASQATA